MSRYSFKLVLMTFSACFFVSGMDPRVEKLAASCDRKYPKVTHIGVVAYRASKDRWLLVDVRSKEERAISTLPGAIDLDTLEKQYDRFKDRNVLFFCTIGERSSSESKKHVGKFPNVANLRGGILAWAAKGLPFITPDGKKTLTVHVYGKRWNILPKRYKGVW